VTLACPLAGHAWLLVLCSRYPGQCGPDGSQARSSAGRSSRDCAAKDSQAIYRTCSHRICQRSTTLRRVKNASKQRDPFPILYYMLTARRTARLKAVLVTPKGPKP